MDQHLLAHLSLFLPGVGVLPYVFMSDISFMFIYRILSHLPSFIHTIPLTYLFYLIFPSAMCIACYKFIWRQKWGIFHDRFHETMTNSPKFDTRQDVGWFSFNSLPKQPQKIFFIHGLIHFQPTKM